MAALFKLPLSSNVSKSSFHRRRWLCSGSLSLSLSRSSSSSSPSWLFAVSSSSTLLDSSKLFKCGGDADDVETVE